MPYALDVATRHLKPS